MSAEKIINSWKKKEFKPLYWFDGEEDYYIDMLMNYAEHQLLSESEAEFNLTVFYGRDADWAAVINACMQTLPHVCRAAGGIVERGTTYERH